MSDISYSDVLKDAQARLGAYLTPSVRLGVTGLSRSGKTVFITALIRNLVTGGRLPFFSPDAERRIVRAYLEPQPDDSVPRFDYEAHLTDLLASPPAWPDGTRRISELRVTIEYRSGNILKRAVGLSKLHVDIVDYPGEWLTDLALLDQDYQAFSDELLGVIGRGAHAALAKPFLDFLAGTDPAGGEDEQVALAGARLFTVFLEGVREAGALATLPPGRFLLPGDLEGSPLLTFFPMRLAAGGRPPRGSLAAMMARRFESYKSIVVKPFFRDHFARLDRQIVLIDVLAALDQGPDAVAELERGMTAVMTSFRPGASSWLSLILLSRRIDRVLFAATKADHLPASSHDRLEAVLKTVVDRALARAQAEGAGVDAVAIAALRATRETKARHDGNLVPCLRGTPLAGEEIGGKIFDGKTEAALFPGDLPADPAEALRDAAALAGSLELVRFTPPRLSDVTKSGEPAAFPHIRLDRALEFLIADYLT